MGKRSYKELLKESIVQEYDTSKTADVKGPMLDAILSYSGDGELPTHQDAASILERYYYGEGEDKGVSVMEAPQNEIPEVPADNLTKAKGDIEDEVESTKPDGDSKAVLVKAGPEDIKETKEAIVEEDLENTVLERLIAELEEQEDMDDEPKDDDEKEMEPKDVEKLDVDKELEEAAGGGSLPGGRTSTGKKLGSSGSFTRDDELEEAFQLFQEQVEDEEDDEKKEEDEVDKGKEEMKGKMVKEQDEKEDDKKDEKGDDKKDEFLKNIKKDEKDEDKKED